MDINAQLWDQRFLPDAFPYGEEPSLYLVEKADLLPARGRALAPGDGGGRNGAWLAARGLDTLTLDYSPVALRRACELAARRGVKLETELADVTAWAWPEAAYDVIVSVYLHLPPGDRPRIHAAMLRALKPGGLLLLEAFHTDQLAYQSGGPRDPALLFTEELLRDDFSGANILELRKDLVPLREGRLHQGPGMLIRMLARKKFQ